MTTESPHGWRPPTRLRVAAWIGTGLIATGLWFVWKPLAPIFVGLMLWAAVVWVAGEESA